MAFRLPGGDWSALVVQPDGDVLTVADELHGALASFAPYATMRMLAEPAPEALPPEQSPPWIRLDLNLPGHDNAEEGLRSHLHPGTDDWSLPSPILSPFEALDLIVRYARPRRRAARA